MSGPGPSRRRSSNKQIDLLVEKVHANPILVRGNWARTDIKKLWQQVALELNAWGCARDVAGWQHIWTTWVTKVRAKARKIRDAISGTGGGPSVPPLSDMEEKILGISGPESVFGMVQMETDVLPRPSPGPSQPVAPSYLPSPQPAMVDLPLPTVYMEFPCPQLEIPCEGGSPCLAASPLLPIVETPAHPERSTEPRPAPRRHRRPARPSRAQRLDPGPTVQAMLQNGRALREVILEHASAIRFAGQEIAAAIRESAQRP